MSSELVAELRSKINPAYADQIGTESHERKRCADAIEALDLEVLRLKELLAGQLTDASLSYAQEFIGITGVIAPMLIEMFAHQFKESHAGNYLEMQFTSSQILPSEQFVVRVQKVAGKTPHQLRLEAEEQRDALRAELKHLSVK
jgi:mannose/fructose-specific phosphotransferase system component IIA